MMPTIQQLQAEPWWGREIVTAELSWLGAELCRRTGRPVDAFGSKGNTAHLSGGHRSQEWLKLSDYCENRSYTVQSGLTELQARHIGACDWTPGVWGSAANRALMVKHTTDLFAAARRGELTGVRQIFGTLNGTSAIGLNVLSNSTTIPDSSHLDHLHLTFDRTHMRDAALMARIADLIGNDMTPEESRQLNNLDSLLSALLADTDVVNNLLTREGAVITQPFPLAKRVRELKAAAAADETRDAAVLAAIQALAAGGTDVDTAAVIARITSEAAATRALVEETHQQEMAELRRAYEAQLAELRDAVADLGEGGAAKVRADGV